MRRLILRSFQSPGDIVMLTAAVRDLHAAAPGQFQTDVRTSAPGLWEHNPHVTSLTESDPGVETLEMHYPLIHQSNQRPYHFIHGYPQYLEERLGLRIPVTRFAGDIHLSSEEKQAPCPGAEHGVPDRFWIVVAGGKHDFTAKWWNPDSYQAVVDHFRGRIQFVQCGEAGHWHPKLAGVIDLIGRTTTREFVRLMHHADGVLCPVTLAMHLAAAVPTRPGGPRQRPCVVIAGGREPPHWEAYPHHQFLSTVGALPCCADGGCWRSRCQLVGDGDAKDRDNVCERPVQVRADLRIAKCMAMITPADVIRRIDTYYEGGAVSNGQCNGHSKGVATAAAPAPQTPRDPLSITEPAARPALAPPPRSRSKTLLEFRHGLGDAVQLTIVLRHLQRYRPDWDVEVATLVGKHSAFAGLCHRVLILERDTIDAATYDRSYQLDWDECRAPAGAAPCTKPSRCLLEVFGLQPIPELCRYQIAVSAAARQRARQYLADVCKAQVGESERCPAVLIHYQGNTSNDRKDLPHEVVRAVCDAILRAGKTPVILDWDRRSPLPNGATIHNPGADHPLWNGVGTGDAEMLAALIEASELMIGIDSGPLHVAGATTTPTLAVWTRHHPARYFDLADNVVHLVPERHVELLAVPAALEFFQNNYRHRVYRQLLSELPALVEALLNGQDLDQLVTRALAGALTATGYGESYYVEHKLAGLDYLGFGDWQQQYGRWFVESLGLRGKRVLDVGCACGAILRGLGEAGAIVQGVELNEHMVRLGRDKWPDMAGLLHVCDAVNLHLFADESWDAVHAAQVAEHWKPELVPHILRELHRVTAPGGLLFAALDTVELFARQGRKLEQEDPTHVCVRTLLWWHQQLETAGWEVCSSEFDRPLRDHPEGFLQRYDWDWFLARKPANSPRDAHGKYCRVATVAARPYDAGLAWEFAGLPPQANARSAMLSPRPQPRRFRDELARVQRAGQPPRPLLYVANGPSAPQAAQARAWGEVATSNQIVQTLPGRIRYAVFADLEPLLAARDAWSRIDTFLLPERFHVNSGPSAVEPSWVPDLPVERVVTFPIEPIIYTDEQTKQAVHDETTLALCNASCVGLHMLALLGYGRIWLFGHDGGTGYAPGIGYVESRDHTANRQRIELLAGALRDKYGTICRFWPERFE